MLGRGHVLRHPAMSVYDGIRELHPCRLVPAGLEEVHLGSELSSLRTLGVGSSSPGLQPITRCGHKDIEVIVLPFLFFAHMAVVLSSVSAVHTSLFA